jgi:hypothetical protein
MIQTLIRGGDVYETKRTNSTAGGHRVTLSLQRVPMLSPPFSEFWIKSNSPHSPLAYDPGSMPRCLYTAPACGEVMNRTSARAASASLAPARIPLENTVYFCTLAGKGPT